MNLTFNNNSTEFHADSHFNIHIEGAGSVSLYKRTSGTDWDYVSDLSDRYSEVVDTDVEVTIPKDYRVTTTATPTMAVVTFKE